MTKKITPKKSVKKEVDLKKWGEELEKVGPGHPLYNPAGIEVDCSSGCCGGLVADFLCCNRHWCEDCFATHLLAEHRAILIGYNK